MFADYATKRHAVHVKGDPKRPARGLLCPPIKTKNGWSYFRLASLLEVDALMDKLEVSAARRRQFRDEVKAATVSA